jgi:hypothetical protein
MEKKDQLTKMPCLDYSHNKDLRTFNNVSEYKNTEDATGTP